MNGDEHHDDVRPQAEHLPRGLIVRSALATIMVGTSLCFATYLIMRARVLAIRPSYDFPERALPAPHEVATVRQESFAVAHPRADLRAQQRTRLDSFGWVDRARGLVHIPIDDAVELTARREAGGRTTGQRP
jgi:hypothetical protein